MAYSPAFGLGFALWCRHHIGLRILGVYLIVLVCAAQLLPAEIVRVIESPFVAALLYLMSIFSSSDADLMSTRSGYPAYLFTLPVRVRTLVLWPMLYGIVSVVGVWFVFAVLVLHSHLGTGLIWGTAALFAALTACLQALCWSPVPLPFLRGILALILFTALTGVGAQWWVSDLPMGVLCAFYLSVIPMAAILAIRGVTLGRAGENRERSWLPAPPTPQFWGELEGKPSLKFAPSFSSSSQAQLWREWKGNGLLFPFLTFFFCLLFVLLSAFIPHPSGEQVPIGVGHIEISQSVRILLLLLMFALLTGQMVGCCPNKAETFRPDLTLQPFFATRPLSSLDLVLAKLRMAAVSTLFAWGISLLFLTVVLFVSAQDGSITGTLGGLLLRYATPKAVCSVVFLLLCLVGWTWRCQVSALWLELSGRPWLIHGFSVVYPVLFTALIGWSVRGVANDPTFLNRILHLLLGLAVCAVVLKGVAAAGAVYALRRFNLVDFSTLVRFMCVWLLIAFGLCCVVLLLMPPGFAPIRYVVLGVVLYLPLGRLLLAPTALHLNRHR